MGRKALDAYDYYCDKCGRKIVIGPGNVDYIDNIYDAKRHDKIQIVCNLCGYALLVPSLFTDKEIKERDSNENSGDGDTQQ